MKRVVALGIIFIATTVAWLLLAEQTRHRSLTQDRGLADAVGALWGRPHSQTAPTFRFEWTTTESVAETRTEGDHTVQVTSERVVEHTSEQPAASTRVGVDLRLDQRRKGLIWYPLYDVGFDGAWTYVHREPQAGTLAVEFDFPDPAGVYDGFRMVLDGTPLAAQPVSGRLTHRIQVKPGQTVRLEVAYHSRGMASWQYVPTSGVSRLDDFALKMTTDFATIDFPVRSLSPVARTRTETGWALDWTFEQVVTGFGVGMVMPDRVQPGELAASLSRSAPVSLFFFFLVLFVLDVLRGVGMHPINYAFLAASFFAFHLLFAYSADLLPVEVAFAVSAVVSVLLVISYLRLVVSARFAFIEAGLAQLVYLVGFGLAHFWSGFAGLTVTLLAVLTLFLLMQWTGRVDWKAVLSSADRSAGPAGTTGGAVPSA